MKLAHSLDKYNISGKFAFRPDRTTGSGVTCPLVPKQTYIRTWPEHSLFSSDWIFMKVADNLDRHKISDKFESRQDGAIHFGVTCPWVQKTKKKKKKKKKNIFYFIWSIV